VYAVQSNSCEYESHNPETPSRPKAAHSALLIIIAAVASWLPAVAGGKS